jgi:putative transposase
VLHKEVPQPLNVVVMVKTHVQTQARAQVRLVSSDLALAVEKVIEYSSVRFQIEYSSVRFQIEFPFRDAKHYWGMDHFMNITATAVTNAANLLLLMVSLSAVLLEHVRQTDPQCRVLDRKASDRGST